MSIKMIEVPAELAAAMKSMKMVELPPELAASLKEHLQQMHQVFDAPAPMLEDSPGGRDLLHLVNTIGKELGERLTRLAASIGSGNMTPRLFTFRQTGKGNKSRWVPFRLSIASIDFLSASTKKLRDLCHEMAEDAPSTVAHIWIHPDPRKGDDFYFAFLRHHDGTEAAYAVDQGKWHRIQASPDALELILQNLLDADRETRNRWVSLLSTGAAASNDVLRLELMPLLYSWGLPPMSDDQWKELLQTLFLREGYWDSIVEAGRALTAPLMHESQYLLDALTGLSGSMKDSFDRRVAQLEKEHSRSLKRMRSELDRTKVMLDGAHTRNRMLVKDVLTLQDKARAQPATPAGTPAAAPQQDVTFAVALDQFFD